ATTVRVLTIDASNGMVLFAGTDNGLFRTIDGGTTWMAATGATGKIYAVAINPVQSNIVLASGTAGVFRSYDGGATFAAMNGGLADLLVNAVGFDKTDPATLWVGTAGAGVNKTP